MLIKDFLVDYKSYTQAKTDIVQKIQSFDTRDKENQKLIDEIYTVLHDTDVIDRFMQATTASLSMDKEYNEQQIITIASQMARSQRLELKDKYKFLDDLTKNDAINAKALLTAGHYSIQNDLCKGKNTSYQMLLEFLTWGKGQKAAGAGEHALAILSQNISVAGVGDISVNGTPVELKVAEKQGSGRMGEAGPSRDNIINVLSAFPEVAEQVIDRMTTKTLNIENFVTAINNIRVGERVEDPETREIRIENPVPLDKARRTEIGKAVFEQRFGNDANDLIAAFAIPGASPADVTNKYIGTNFNWYKANEMGGKWEVLVSMAIKSGGFIVAKTGKDFINLINNGALYKNTPAVIHTSRPPEIYYQVNPTAK